MDHRCLTLVLLTVFLLDIQNRQLNTSSENPAPSQSERLPVDWKARSHFAYVQKTQLGCVRGCSSSRRPHGVLLLDIVAAAVDIIDKEFNFEWSFGPDIVFEQNL